MMRFALLRQIDGYLPLEAYGLIGDGTTAVLVGRDGTIAWWCVPRFDSPPLFCRILDAVRGGACTVTPEELVESRRCRSPAGALSVTATQGSNCFCYYGGERRTALSPAHPGRLVAGDHRRLASLEALYRL